MEGAIITSFLVMLLTQIYKKLIERFGIEKTRLTIHGFLFVVSLVIALLKYYGYWKLFLPQLVTVWTMASGEYEVLKTIFEKVWEKVEK